MICIILVAGHTTTLENEIKTTAGYEHLHGVPKALLPGVGGRRILDYWWDAIKMRQLFTEVYLVTNADKYKHFERWATASDFPVENIINDGTTTHSNRIGAVTDLDLVLRIKKVNDDFLVVSGDMLFQDDRFDMVQVLRYFHSKPSGDLAIYYEMLPEESTTSRGIVDVNPADNRITHFHEKPEPEIVKSRLASVVFYCLRKETRTSLTGFLAQTTELNERSFGRFLEWHINEKEQPVYGMKLPTGFQLIGQVTVADYQRWLEFFSDKQREHTEGRSQTITKRAYARVGLIGNPSDGFNGKTIALSICNFWAEVSLTESEKLVLMPHPLNDPTEFGSLSDLHGISRKEGYLGGLRLLQATCTKFYQYCSERGVALTKRNFTLKYDTNIPRQVVLHEAVPDVVVGLAGSSAIVTATLKCLMEFFHVTDADLPKAVQPDFILSVEMKELFIQAGLQDRVIQIYEGLCYMDFSKELFDKQGHGIYENMSLEELPTFWIAYLTEPSDSGKIHSDVGTRWRQGEQKVVDAMRSFASFTDEAKCAIEQKDWKQLMELMNKNFELRKQVYGDAALGESNLRMIEIGRKFGSAVKFPGSGGAVLGLCLDTDKMECMKKAFQEEGCVFCEVVPNPGGNNHNPPAR